MAFLVIKENGLKSPEEDKEAFDIIAKGKIISETLATRLKDAKGMRNIIAHEYGKIDDKIVFEAITEELERDVKEFIKKELNYDGKIIFPEHHESHAASAFFPSPFQEAAFLTVDGVGEWATTSYGIGKGNKIDILAEIHFPHSLGLLYSAFTYYTGFKVNSGEYKVMGLAPYGEPRYKDLILSEAQVENLFLLLKEPMLTYVFKKTVCNMSSTDSLVRPLMRFT